MSQEFDRDLAKLWEVASGKLMDKHLLVNCLEELLRNYGITEQSLIFDVAGGFGFPAIELAKRGYQVVYSDGSRAMLERAMRNAELAGAPSYIFAHQWCGYNAVAWQVFAEAYGEEAYDALICRGNSLPYAVSWGKENSDLGQARDQIKQALEQFHRVLTPQGILYVDKQPEAQDRAVENVGEIELEGIKFNLVCTFDNDKVRRVRNWTLTTRNLESGEIKDYPSRGYLLLEDELNLLLHEAGFREIHKHVLEGDIYEGLVARK